MRNGTHRGGSRELCALTAQHGDEIDERTSTVMDAVFVFDLEIAQILGFVVINSKKRRWLVTDFVERELRTPNMPMLKHLGLEVVPLTGSQMGEVHTLGQRYLSLSDADLTCLVYARDHNVPLVTRDKKLREAAKEQGVRLLDTHHVLVELVADGTMSCADAAGALETIQKKRLNDPRSDWTALIKRWRSVP